MPDILIRDVPEDVVSAVDVRAQQMGLSRNEYLRRKLAQGTFCSGPPGRRRRELTVLTVLLDDSDFERIAN